MGAPWPPPHACVGIPPNSAALAVSMSRIGLVSSDDCFVVENKHTSFNWPPKCVLQNVSGYYPPRFKVVAKLHLSYEPSTQGFMEDVAAETLDSLRQSSKLFYVGVLMMDA
jgi:hypothetical protein